MRPAKLAPAPGLWYASAMTEQQRLTVLYDYASGHAGTRATLDKLGLRDFAELVVALSQADLPFPKPAETAALAAHRERARAILQPRLRHGD